ncbi:MAG: hypothetical protein AAF321_06235 [Pseudomonadota bacterium]
MTLTPAERYGRKRFNERIKMVASYVHGLALAVVGFGVIREAVAPDISFDGWRLGTIFAVSLATEAVAVYIVGLIRAED